MGRFVLAGLGVNNRSKGTWATHPNWIYTTSSEPHKYMLLSYIPVIHMYLWSVHAHVVRGTDQGVAQLQQEVSPNFETQIPLAVIFPGYTVIKGDGGLGFGTVVRT